MLAPESSLRTAPVTRTQLSYQEFEGQCIRIGPHSLYTEVHYRSKDSFRERVMKRIDRALSATSESIATAKRDADEWYRLYCAASAQERT